MVELTNRYCFDCHSASEPKAGLNLEQVVSQVKQSETLSERATWEKVIKRLRARQMPPVDAELPDEPECKAALTAIESTSISPPSRILSLLQPLTVVITEFNEARCIVVDRAKWIVASLGDFVIRICDIGFNAIESAHRWLGRNPVKTISTDNSTKRKRVDAALRSQATPYKRFDPVTRSPCRQNMSLIVLNREHVAKASVLAQSDKHLMKWI